MTFEEYKYLVTQVIFSLFTPGPWVRQPDDDALRTQANTDIIRSLPTGDPDVVTFYNFVKVSMVGNYQRVPDNIPNALKTIYAEYVEQLETLGAGSAPTEKFCGDCMDGFLIAIKRDGAREYPMYFRCPKCNSDGPELIASMTKREIAAKTCMGGLELVPDGFVKIALRQAR